MSCDCGSSTFDAAISTHSSWRPVDVDDDVLYLNPLDFESPDYMEVESRCRTCGRTRVLANEEWTMS